MAGGGAFDGYTPVRELGRGGAGVVLVARDDRTGALVAIKVLAADLAGDPEFRAAFREEARLLASLRHPNIAAFHWYRDTDEPAIAMELVDGVALRQLIARGSTTPEGALAVLRGSLLALDHVHRAGLVHRDYKPGNVLVDRAGQSRLVDFGITVRSGAAGVVAGTPSYAAPEQWAGHPASPGTDVYAATAVLVECVTGRPPYAAADPRTLREMHVNAPIPLDGVPPALRAMVARGMAKDPQGRYPGAAAFLAQLEHDAAAGYGRDWLVRGTAAVGGAVVALAAAVPLSAAASAPTWTPPTHPAPAPASPPTAPPSPAPVRTVSRLGRASSRATSALAGAAAGAVIAVGALGLTHSGPFRAGPSPVAALTATALSADFGARRGGLPPTAAGGGSAALAGNSLVVAPDGHLVQTLVITAPQDAALRFAFCDGQVCGTSENFDCVGNLEIPSFGGATPLSLEVAPPPGAHLLRMLTVAGSGAGATPDVGYYDPADTSAWNRSTLAETPSVSGSGALRLRFQSPIAADIAAHTRGGQVCGFTVDEAHAFTARYGPTLHNTSTALVRLVIAWSPAAATPPGATQPITLNGAVMKQPLTTTPVPRAAAVPPALRQDDSRWVSAASAPGGPPFGRTGTVPTTVSMLLAAFGITLDPPVVGTELIAAGAWHPGKGTDWPALGAYVVSKKLAAAEVDLLGAIDTLQNGGEVLVASTLSGAGRESTLLLTGYDPGTDSFAVLDPLQGAIRLGWNDLLATNPWFLATTRPVPAA